MREGVVRGVQSHIHMHLSLMHRLLFSQVNGSEADFEYEEITLERVGVQVP